MARFTMSLQLLMAVLSVAWALRCVVQGMRVPVSPIDAIHAGAALRESFRARFDDDEDGYFDDATAHSLRRSMELAGRRVVEADDALMARLFHDPDAAVAAARRRLAALVADE